MNSNSGSAISDISKNIIVLGLLKVPNENIVSRVNTLVKEGLKLQNITCDSTVRKSSTK